MFYVLPFSSCSEPFERTMSILRSLLHLTHIPSWKIKSLLSFLLLWLLLFFLFCYCCYCCCCCWCCTLSMRRSYREEGEGSWSWTGTSCNLTISNYFFSHLAVCLYPKIDKRLSETRSYRLCIAHFKIFSLSQQTELALLY